MNYITSEQKEALIIFMEESAECIQAASKIYRFGLTDTKKVELEKEIGDILCMIQILSKLELCDATYLDDYIQNKTEKLKVWSNLSCLND